MASSVRLSPLQIDFLNLVRAAAAQLVLVGHAMPYYLHNPLDASGRPATMGVLIFFILSGFLICSSVAQKWDRFDYRFEHFLIDRFCRIFVAFVPALVFVAAVDAVLRTHPDYPFQSDYSLGTWLGNLGMLQDYPVFQVLRRLGVPEQSWFIRPFGSGRPFWTVSIEWWIYLSFGCAAFFLLRHRRLSLGTLLMFAVLSIVPIYNAMGGVGDCLTLVWVMGALFALLQNWLANRPAAEGPPDRRRAIRVLSLIAIALSGLLLAGRVVVTGFRVYDLQFAMFVGGILFGCFFLAGTVPTVLPRSARRVIDFCANYSYSLYLIHFTVLTGFILYLPSPTHHDAPMFVGIFATANVVAIVFWAAFERHYRAAAQFAKNAVDKRRLRTAGDAWAPAAEP